MGFGSCRRPIGILHQWQIMAQNLTFWVRWNHIFPIFPHIFPQYPMTTLRLAMDRTQAFRPSRFGSCGRFDPGLGSSWLPYLGHDLLGGLEHDLEHDFYMTFRLSYIFIYGMSSFPLTKSYVSRWLKPPTSNKWLPSGDFTVRALENHHVYER